ncbi:hypothetical protein M758_11G153200 [Ceratodon purpureus]|nr:hypothetical protein M758_11G153200 [Ceratodon purpureus]
MAAGVVQPVFLHLLCNQTSSSDMIRILITLHFWDSQCGGLGVLIRSVAMAGRTLASSYISIPQRPLLSSCSFNSTDEGGLYLTHRRLQGQGEK